MKKEKTPKPAKFVNENGKLEQNFVFEIPSIHSGKVHVVVARDFWRACYVLAVYRSKESAKENEEKWSREDIEKFARSRAKGYAQRYALRYADAHFGPEPVVVETPSSEPEGVIEINRVVAKEAVAEESAEAEAE